MRGLFIAMAACSFACTPRPMVLSAEQLVRAAPYPSAEEERRATEARTPMPTGSVDVVEGGERIRMPRAFDLVIVPNRGPSRRFLRPVSARVEDGALLVSGSNRRLESRILIENIASITLFRSNLPVANDEEQIADRVGRGRGCDALRSLSVDRLSEERFAVLGCGVAGIYSCHIELSVAMSADHRVRCSPDEDGLDAWRAAVGAWAEGNDEPESAAEVAAQPDGARALADELTSSILECAGQERLALYLQATADCHVTADLRDARDDAEQVEGCIDALFAQRSLEHCGPPGRVLHVVHASE
jgi:hypothetical protein